MWRRSASHQARHSGNRTEVRTLIPYYFENGNFVDINGPQHFEGERTYTSLPTGKPIHVDRFNYTQLAREVWIPNSMLAAYTAGLHYVRYLPPVEDWLYLDIETNSDGTYKTGVLNQQTYNSPTDLIQAIETQRKLGHNVIAGYNILKFDNRVLAQKYRQLAHMKFGSYDVYYFPNMVNVDLWFWARNYFSDAEAKSLRDLAQASGYPVNWSLTDYDEKRALEDNKMSLHLAKTMNVPEGWEILLTLANCDPLILQSVFLDRMHKAILHNWYLNHNYLPVSVQCQACNRWYSIELLRKHLIRYGQLAPKENELRFIVDKDGLMDCVLCYKRLEPGDIDPHMQEDHGDDFHVAKKESPGPLRESKPGFYNNMAYWDAQSAYLVKAARLDLKIYDLEQAPAFSGVMSEMLRLIEAHPRQKPMLKFLGVSLVGAMNSDNQFFRSEQIYNKVVGGFRQEFADYLASRDPQPAYIHTDGFLMRAGVAIPQMPGYTIRQKQRYKWVIIYNDHNTLGLLEDGTIHARGFQTYSSTFPRVLADIKQQLYHYLATHDETRVRRVLKNPRQLIIGTRPAIKIRADRYYWTNTVWKENEVFPEKWDENSPLFVEWADLKTGPNTYDWRARKDRREWVEDLIDKMLKQYRFAGINA